jgi:hypothetical protein
MVSGAGGRMQFSYASREPPVGTASLLGLAVNVLCFLAFRVFLIVGSVMSFRQRIGAVVSPPHRAARSKRRTEGASF